MVFKDKLQRAKKSNDPIMENSIIIKTIDPNLEEIRKNLILMQQSPTPQTILKCEKFFDFYTGKLRTISQCESGYSTAESSRKSSLDTEEDSEEISQVQESKFDVDPKLRAEFLIKQLLIDIYGRPYSEVTDNDDNPILQNLESDCTSNVSMNDFDRYTGLDYSYLSNLDINEIRLIFDEFTEQITYAGQVLIRQLRRRDKLMLRRERQYDIITAYLKSEFSNDGDGGDTSNMRFSMSPSPGDSGYNQWLDAMKMVSQLPGGIPPEFRKRLWITLAERYLQTKGVNWSQTERACFNEWSNPDDTELGVQIVKDLHRTGCSLFCGTAGQENQALLKRVLLAYARWNKAVGYCQGFNMLAALILQVMDRSEVDSVKVMIYLIEGVLPESYFANNLRGLSVDMAVFRDLLRLRLPNLSRHLDALQNDVHEGTSYEPPLTNVFTMQWFLTLFCNCLPQITVLRVWDLIFLEGNEVLLRTALAIWDGLADRILAVNSADEFYSIMGVLTREMLEFGFMDANTLVKSIVSIQVSQELPELRDKYLYNITPWTQTVQSAAKKGFRLFYSDDDDLDSDNDEKMAVTTVYGISLRKRRDSERRASATTSTIQPYAYGHPDREKLALDISALKQQYAKLRERQRQAHIILTAACARQPINHSPNPAPIAMNHLLLGKSAILSVRGRRLGPPQGAVPPSRSQKKAQKSSSPKENGETIHWKDTAKRRPSRQYSQEELQKDRISQSNSAETIETISSHHHSGGDSSSSYSSDQDDDDEDDASSTSTELCDEPGRASDIDDLADIPSDVIDSDVYLRTNNSSDVVKSVSESKLEEVKEMANLITHSFSESVLRPECTMIEFNEKQNFDSIEESNPSPEPEKSYLSNILENDEEIAQILENWNSPKKENNETDQLISDIIETTPEPVADSPPKTPVEILIDFEQVVSDIKQEDIEKSNVQSPQIEAIINDDQTKLITSSETSEIRVKPKFETSRSIEVLRENQTILDNYLKQQGLKIKDSDDNESDIHDKSVYSSLFFSETLCSNSSNSDRKNITRQSDKNSYDNNVILADTTNNLNINNSETEPNFDNFVLQRSALSSNSCVNKSGASTPVNNFDFAKYLRDRGIDLSPEDILKIQQSPPDKVDDILEKILTPLSPKSFSSHFETNDQSKTLEPFNLKPNTPEQEVSSTSQRQTSEFEKFLEDRIKFIKQLSIDSMSSTKVRFDSGSDWHKTPSTDEQCTDRKVSISSETGEEKDDVFEHNEILSPKSSSQVEASSDLSPETLEIIKKYEEIFDKKSEKVTSSEGLTTPDQKPKGRLSFEKQISLESLSIPEERFETGRRNSEMALKIIQENSMILHKILQCQTHSIDELDEDLKKSSPEIDAKSTNLYQATDDEKLRRNSEIKDLDVTFKWDPGVYDDNNIEIDKQSTQINNSETIVTSPTKEINDSNNTLSRPSSFSQLQFPSLASPTNKKKTPSPIDNFNPFPVRSTTRQHKDVGLKLGLYKDLSPLKSPTK